jgi:hypothetical protein
MVYLMAGSNPARQIDRETLSGFTVGFAPRYVYKQDTFG